MTRPPTPAPGPCAWSRWGRALWLVALLGALSSAWAATCEPVPEGALEVVVEGLGSLYFSTLTPDPATGRLELGGGVCVVGAGGWVLRGEQLWASGLDAQPELEAENVQLAAANFWAHAERLSYGASGVRLAGLVFGVGSISGSITSGVTGTAAAGTFAPETSELVLAQVRLQGQGFWVEGRMATLGREALVVEDAAASTCDCPGGSVYTVRAPRLSYELARQVLRLEEGRLEVGVLSFPLDDLALSPASLSTLRFPLAIEYVPDSAAGAGRGTGLGLRVPEVPVAEALTLELGVLGLDLDYPLRGVLVAHYEDEGRAFDVGLTGSGPQADLRLRAPLAEWLTARFEVANRHYPASDFLHEGVLGVTASTRLAVFGGDELRLSQDAFAAASGQTLASGPVHDARLGLAAEAAYRAPRAAFGQFGVSLRAQATRYPATGQSQLGLRLRPGWSARFGGLSLNVGYDLLLTNAASPFGVSLDRLEARSLFTASARYSAALGPSGAPVTAPVTLGVSVAYDALDPAPTGRLLERLSLLQAEVELAWQEGEVSFRPYALAELAPVFNADLRPRRAAFVEVGVDIGAARTRFGLATRFEVLRPDPLTKLETSLSFPLDFGDVALQPFLALDLLPTLSALALPRVSGHGLEVTYRSCCGTLTVGYRQQENRFSTSFGLKLNDR